MRAGLLALVLLVAGGSAAAMPLAPTPLTAEALLAADVSAKTVQAVAGRHWWPEPPAFDTVVFQSDPQPKITTGVTFERLGGDATITTTLYAFRSNDQSTRFLLYAELVGPPVDEKNPAVGERRAYYRTTLPSGAPATRLYFTRGRVGSGRLKPPVIPPADLARMPAVRIAPGPLLGTTAISNEAWATVDRDSTPRRVRDGLTKRGAKLLFRRYLRQGSPTDVIETTLFTFASTGAASGWFAPFGAGVKHGEGSLDAGATGADAAFRQGRDNFELRFAVGRYVGDVFCYAPFVTNPSAACEDAVRTLAERWYTQLARVK